MCVCARVCVYVYVCVPVCNKMKIEGCRHIDRDKQNEVETLGGLRLELSLCVRVRAHTCGCVPVY